ncbi:TrbI F-type domain-containing protein [Vibrio parahaemolyticus]|uniref:TrbI F-type domain-containing protein n=1 Tax=Vibrio parahaemolyticus TaxID=670 RepID=A0A9Q3YL52_VIBPH|nr:TrbI F-type domain-containing protein [Vibrio parahaemolyticus]EGQ8101945.1 conjugal transfer protein [Vibrio parahaemolyticus]EGQ8548730.1 conjugal transfer protein [Vibrio parahaemolyticus]EGQ9073829.1 conjugal transfer protein [Vibrio parahaemolyticus]EGQ9129652.1 conjugal transfer protein [Vibrio parahaemolyticus]EGQ9286411.1 conjugal transfer protein [Vibrio parahaemolyticus]
MKKHLPLMTALLSIGLAVITTAALTLTRPPQTVVFDIKGTLDAYQDNLLQANLTDDEHRKQLARFDKELRLILDDYAKAHHLTIVVPAAVISGAPDMTTELQHHVIKQMKRHKQQSE